MAIQICQLCKDPIWSFICPHCLARDIGNWLPKNLKGAYKKFNKNFFGNFSFTIDLDGLRCIHCKKMRLANICTFCYLAEVYDWLRRNNRRLAENIFRMLPLASDWRLDKKAGVIWSSGLVPVSDTELELRDEGVCEACDRYSDELSNFDGRWICKECETLEK
jgi:hypothetical protein